MQQSFHNWQNSRAKTQYYNPISKIRALIHNLDEELLQLNNQCTVPRTPAIALPSIEPAETKKRTSYTYNGAMMGTSTESNGPSHIRAMSNLYRSKVIDAYRSRRIFTVYGNYHTVRRQLLRRGWLEKMSPGRYPKLQNLTEEVLLSHAKRGNEYEAVAISKIINRFPAFFIWQAKGMRDLDADVFPFRNRVRRGRDMDFSTKVGLIGCAEQSQWFHQEGLSGMSYPRFYRLGGGYEERLAFVEDFRRTQARSLLRFVLEKINTPEEVIDETFGRISPKILGFALVSVRQELADWEHEGIDDDSTKAEGDDISDWTTFLVNSSIVLDQKGKINCNLPQLMEYMKYVRPLLDKIELRRPDYNWDGTRNLWILKPGYQCRGIGIIIRSSLDDIMLWATNNSNRRYIAQKYIERPLLIYKTKFDIRQYMLLSIGSSMASLWMYKDCYLRFSSQEFSVDDLRESIHLTNNSVQKRYKNKADRDSRLPKNNMWSLQQFKVYLRHQHAPDDTWDKIYAGLTANLRAVVMASMEETNFVPNAFEMYGCDFMLDENYNPILIEINSTPDLSPSTEVTARICPNALKDLIKVIVDLPKNENVQTGLFEKVFEINYKQKGKIETPDSLNVSGKTITLFKPLANRQKFWKKTFKYVKKPEMAINFAAKKLKEKSHSIATGGFSVKNDAKERKRYSGGGGVTRHYSVDAKTINSAQKEALAMKYTLPK